MFLETTINEENKKNLTILLEGMDTEDDFSGAITCVGVSLPDTVKIVIEEDYEYDGYNLEIDFIAATIGYSVSECTKLSAELVRE